MSVSDSKYSTWAWNTCAHLIFCRTSPCNESDPPHWPRRAPGISSLPQWLPSVWSRPALWLGSYMSPAGTSAECLLQTQTHTIAMYTVSVMQLQSSQSWMQGICMYWIIKFICSKFEAVFIHPTEYASAHNRMIRLKKSIFLFSAITLQQPKISQFRVSIVS